MDITENERLQEFILVVEDKLATVSRTWWYALAVFLILLIPAYITIKSAFTTAFLAGYSGPKMIYTVANKEALQVIDKKIFTLPDNTYGGYVKIRNINLEWGVPNQPYTVEFRTYGGTVVNSISKATYILPASEKLLVLPRFQADKKPDEIVVTLGESSFTHKPDTQIAFDVQRTSIQNSSTGLQVSAAFINQTPFIIRQVDLPVAVYDSQNQIVAVNFTNVNDVKANETRTFTYSWPASVAGAVRAEVNPEVNIFDRNILSTEPGTSEFDSTKKPQ